VVALAMTIVNTCESLRGYIREHRKWAGTNRK
jgi:hypothetical protein